MSSDCFFVKHLLLTFSAWFVYAHMSPSLFKIAFLHIIRYFKQLLNISHVNSLCDDIMKNSRAKHFFQFQYTSISILSTQMNHSSTAINPSLILFFFKIFLKFFFCLKGGCFFNVGMASLPTNFEEITQIRTFIGKLEPLFS